MRVAILDDYQDVVRHLGCFREPDGHEVKVFTHRARNRTAPRTAGRLRRARAHPQPHLGFTERQAYEWMLGGAFANIVAFAAGKPVNLVPA